MVTYLAHVHSNETIERRYRTLEEVVNALMIQGGAGILQWECAVPTANFKFVMNLTLKDKDLQAAGLPGSGRERPLTPYEKFVNHGTQAKLTQLWASILPLFTACTGYIEERISGHTNRGFPGLYFGIIPLHGKFNVTSHGHYVLRESDKTIVKMRTVLCQIGNYPIRAAPQRPLGARQSMLNHAPSPAVPRYAWESDIPPAPSS